eukprot:242596_1
MAQKISDLQSTVSSQSSTINTYKTAHTTMEDEQKKQSESADKKRKEFVPKVDEMINKYSSNSEAKEDSPADINLNTLQKDQDEIDQLLQQSKSATAQTESYVKFTQDLGQQVTDTPTYEDQQKKQEGINKCNVAQAQISAKRKTATDQKQKILAKENKLSKDKINIEKGKVKARETENALNNDLVKSDKLRTELNQVTGAEMNANPAAFDKMKEKFNQLCELLKTKHAENKQKMKQLEKCEEKVHDMQTKLKKQKLQNKYLIKLLDEEYKRMSAAKEDIRTKYEERGTYFLAVSCGLKQDVIEKLEEIVGEEHDMDLIQEIKAEDLIEVGIDNRILRVKILKAIIKLN